MKPKKEVKSKETTCPNKHDCVIKTYMDEKEKITQCEVCSKIINIQ